MCLVNRAFFAAPPPHSASLPLHGTPRIWPAISNSRCLPATPRNHLLAQRFRLFHDPSVSTFDQRVPLDFAIAGLHQKRDDPRAVPETRSDCTCLAAEAPPLTIRSSCLHVRTRTVKNAVRAGTASRMRQPSSERQVTSCRTVLMGPCHSAFIGSICSASFPVSAPIRRSDAFRFVRATRSPKPRADQVASASVSVSARRFRK